MRQRITRILFTSFLAVAFLATIPGCSKPQSDTETTDSESTREVTSDKTEASEADTDTITDSFENTETRGIAEEDETETTPPLSNVEEYEFFYDYWLEGDDTAVKRGDQIRLYTYVKNVTDRDITYWGTSNFLMPIAEVFTTDSEGCRYSIPYMIAGNADADNLRTFPAGGTSGNTALIDIPLDAPAGQYSLEIQLNETSVSVLICENFFVLDELPAEEPTETAE